jgi:hypothetical protein
MRCNDLSPLVLYYISSTFGMHNFKPSLKNNERENGQGKVSQKRELKLKAPLSLYS